MVFYTRVSASWLSQSCSLVFFFFSLKCGGIVFDWCCSNFETIRCFGIGAHQYSQQKCRRGDWIWGSGVRVQVRLSTCQLRFCRLRSSLCVKKKKTNSSRLPCLGAGSVFISALTHFVLDHNGCMSVKWLYSDLREQTCYRMSSGFSIWPPGCDLTRLPSHGVTILFLCKAVYRAMTHHTSVYSNLWGPPDCSNSAWTVCVRASVCACVRVAVSNPQRGNVF